MTQFQTGVLLVNLGTPEAPTPQAIKRYLSPFLHDKRVVDTSRWIWCPVLHGIVLPSRSPRVAKLYQQVWMPEGSPLLVYSRRQQKALQETLVDTPVELAMTYGVPSMKHAVSALMNKGIKRLIVLPLFPQYSCSTTAAVWDSLAAEFKHHRNLPEIHFIRDYAEHPAYIEALSRRILCHFEQKGQPDLLLFSYHGIPERYAMEGDDYPLRCKATTHAVVEHLGLTSEQYMMTYQSRFGREPWLTPYTDETLKSLPEKGIKTVQVVCPGFASDCLETLEEIAVQNRNFFVEAGGLSYDYIPALNDEPDHIALLRQLVSSYLEK